MTTKKQGLPEPYIIHEERPKDYGHDGFAKTSLTLRRDNQGRVFLSVKNAYNPGSYGRSIRVQLKRDDITRLLKGWAKLTQEPDAPEPGVV